MQTNNKSIMGIPISTNAHQHVLDQMERRIREGKRGGYISITNTESMYHALRKPAHLAYIKGADFSLCDGVGVIAAGYFWGLRTKRYNGPILQLDCCDFGQPHGWRHFFYGGKEGVAELMADRLKEQFPGLRVVGTYCPPFRELTQAEDNDVVQLINSAKPDIVWVGLGLIKQEAWIASHLKRIDAPWMVGVGAAFDYHSGAVPWAPAFLRALGLEWIFRLMVQPRLRARRYWWSLLFVVEAAAAGLMRPVKFIMKETTTPWGK